MYSVVFSSTNGDCVLPRKCAIAQKAVRYECNRSFVPFLSIITKIAEDPELIATSLQSFASTTMNCN
uniref:hypothetical protein n=1 Tax=Scytonema sp. HK-05 TaxID=1137095 RepID=UPI000A8E5885